MRSSLALTALVFSLTFESTAQVTLSPLPSRAIGQDSTTLTGVSPNLVEGREFYDPQGLALDTSTNPPALYVADTGNNRVLGFRSAVGYSNGQKADLVLGQPDFATTLFAGPGHSGSNTGLYAPTGIAVDAAGNVYVVDSGNNRVIRYPRPFAQTGQPAPDIVIGQHDFTTSGANQGGISAATLNLNGANGPFDAYAALDSSGNLWVSDSGNNRVLRFNASVLGANAASGPPADIVIGQPNFTSNAYAPASNINPLTSTIAFESPAGIAFDTKGRLFVAESVSSRRGRVLVYYPPFTTGQSASRILGVDLDTPQPPAISQFQFAQAPGAIFPAGDGIGVVDTYDSRVLLFPPIEQWTSNTLYQAATSEAGQPDFSSGSSNQGQPASSASTLSLPAGAAFYNSTLFVADSFNHRVIALAQNGSSFSPATAVLGQDGLAFNTANLIEGREFDFTAGGDAGVVVDTASNPPHLYVADTYNNRILGFMDARRAMTGAKADLVIGQPGFQTSQVNYPSNSATVRTAASLYSPTGLAVDSFGNLYVADTGNGRVLRFPAPFTNYAPGVMQQADLVLGQLDFSSYVSDPTPRTLAAPYGLAFTTTAGLAVSDFAQNRVIWFQGNSAQLTSGMAATLVIGQADFTSAGSGSGLNQFNGPRHIATDIDDRLFVADTGNGRVLAFDRIPLAVNGQYAAYSLDSRAGLHQPRGVAVDKSDQNVWVADPSAGAIIRFPSYEDVVGSECNNCGTSIPDPGPLAGAVDASGDLYVADSANRIGIFYPGLAPLNAANYLSNYPLAPGMIAALYSLGNGFGGAGQSASSLPLPTQLNGLEVLFNGAPAPLFYAGPAQINFQVPMGAPQSGTADVQVVNVSTGQTVGAWPANMGAVSPGLFTTAANGIGSAAALNQDNTPNSPSNPALAGTIVQLFGTGQGFIPGAPADGNVSNAALSTPQVPQVVMGDTFVDSSAITYSGLAPTLVGVWQINVKIPSDLITLPNNPVQVVVLTNNIPSGGGGIGRLVEIYVKQPQ